MNWYRAVLKKYATFGGRAGRAEFWMFFLINFLIIMGLVMIDTLIGLGFLGGLYGLAVFLPTLAVYVRRLHDSGRTGWWMLIAFIPLIGFLVLLIFMLLEGNPGDNEYGPPPAATA